MRPPDLSVVIPAYNEADCLGASLEAIHATLSASGLAIETLVVDDGSTDETASVAGAHLTGSAGRVVSVERNRGKGHAVRRGFAEASGAWVLVTDADLSCPIEEYATLAEAARASRLDVVIGSRGLPGSRVVVAQHPVRTQMGKTFNRILRPLTGLPFFDTQCGFKLLHRERTRHLVEQLVVDGFAYDVELLVVCLHAGLQVAEVPVVWRNRPASHVKLFSDPARMLVDLARVWWRVRRRAYRVSIQPDAAPWSAPR